MRRPAGRGAFTAAIFTTALGAALNLTLTSSGWAEEPMSFKGKTVTMVIPTTVGAGTDLSGRLFGKFFAKHLPGTPAIVYHNMPGGGGVAALNFLTQIAKPDGLTMSVAGSSQLDPVNYRSPLSKYDPANMQIIGSVGPGDSAMIIRADALPRLLDKSQPPVAMGSVAGVPRAAMRMTAWGIEYLGWNAKWVVGYPGSNDLALAMERGEIDMTAFPILYLLDKLTNTEKFKIVTQDGEGPVERPTGRADIDAAPSFHQAMAGKITDAKARDAYDYWVLSRVSNLKWMSLPPKTPAAIRDLYRAAFRKTVVDPEFLTLADQIIPGFTVVTAERTEQIIDNFAKTTPEAIESLDNIMRKQGLKIVKGGSQSDAR